MRQVVLDTETTGIDPKSGHRIIEIGCVELINRRLTGNNYHQYINPEREVEAEAIAVHGITNEFLVDKPVFSEIIDSFYQYVRGAELIIHNAAFDVGFLDHEIQKLDNASAYGKMTDFCEVVDTLMMARKKHRGQKNNLDALCRRYEIDNSHRELHGALLDAEILADVYLAMTGGQISLSLAGKDGESAHHEGAEGASGVQRVASGRPALKVVSASNEEVEAHQQLLDVIRQRSGEKLEWS